MNKVYDEMKTERQNGNFQFEEDPFTKDARGISKIYHEVLFSMKFLQTKPQVESMNFKYNDLYYTVIKNRKDNVEEHDIIDVDESDHISYEDFFTPNHYIGRKNDNGILR